MKALTLLSLAAAATLGTVRVHAQDYPVASAGTPIQSLQGGYRNASTVAEGRLRGAADLVRAVGESNYNNSLAKIHREEARALYLENKALKAKIYFEKRRLNREALAAERGPRSTPEQLRAYARAAAPERLNSYEFEPSTGAINWPAVLLGDDLADEREVVGQAMASRDTTNSGVGSRTSCVVSEATGRMKAVLKANIDTMSSMDYIVGKRFLTSLSYEAQLMPNAEGIASR